MFSDSKHFNVPDIVHCGYVCILCILIHLMLTTILYGVHYCYHWKVRK